jgi:hypothetical protein
VGPAIYHGVVASVPKAESTTAGILKLYKTKPFICQLVVLRNTQTRLTEETAFLYTLRWSSG